MSVSLVPSQPDQFHEYPPTESSKSFPYSEAVEICVNPHENVGRIVTGTVLQAERGIEQDAKGTNGGRVSLRGWRQSGEGEHLVDERVIILLQFPGPIRRAIASAIRREPNATAHYMIYTAEQEEMGLL